MAASDDSPMRRALMRNTARRLRPEAEAWAVDALRRPADELVWLAPDEAYDLRQAFEEQHGSVLRDETTVGVVVTLKTGDEAAFDDGIRRSAPVVRAPSELVWLLDVPGHGLLIDAEDLLSRTRAMIRQDDIALEVLSRDRAVGFYADIDTSGGHAPPEYVVRCWQSS